MDTIEAMKKRNSVRRYTDKKIEGDVLTALQAEVDKCNDESGLNIRLVTDDPDTFNSLFARAMFSGTRNFFVLAGKDDADLDEKAGFYGERLVIKAQQLGLNTCWAAMFSGKKFSSKLDKGERIAIVVSVGYGETQGEPHKNKPMESLYKVDGDMPDWFRSGMEAAMLAPTAMNRQRFLFTLSGNTVKAECNNGRYSKIDLGIVKYHFEIGAGADNFRWA